MGAGQEVTTSFGKMDVLGTNVPFVHCSWTMFSLLSNTKSARCWQDTVLAALPLIIGKLVPQVQVGRGPTGTTPTILLPARCQGITLEIALGHSSRFHKQTRIE